MEAWSKRFLLSVTLLISLGCLWEPLSAQTVSATTWHNDNLRTGDNLNETALTPGTTGTVAAGNFGQLCSAVLDGPVYSQPLVVANVTVLGTAFVSAVFVVTESATLYAINGTPPASGHACQVIGSESLLPSNQYPADCNYLGGGNGSACTNTIYPSVGILATPVIGTLIPGQPHSKWPLYAVTETQNCQGRCSPSTWNHYLHAVDIQSLTEITAPVRVYPPTFTVTQASTWSFLHIQRPGLLLTPDDYLYVAFSMMDGNSPLPSGSIFRYDASTGLSQYNPPNTLQPLYFSTTPDTNPDGGGVWQDGGGLAYGPDDNSVNALYFNTGNGLYDGSSNFGDSFMKLSTSLTVSGSFTPGDQAWRNCASPNYTDSDFGSGAPMLTPATSQWPHIAISGEKEGYIWVMDRLSPGGYSSNNSACPTLQNCTQTNDSAISFACVGRFSHYGGFR